MIDILIVITVFSIIQSLFGVGLLLFGTPTLLLVGYSYSETLWILLPCSLIISLIQITANYDLVTAKKKVAYFTVPIMILSLIFIVSYDYVIDIKKVVGFFLLLTGIINFVPKLQVYLKLFIRKQLRFYYVLIGFIHGISNMGGGPLSLLMSTMHRSKEKIRVNIAFTYLVLSVFQLIALFIIESTGLKYVSIKLMSVSLGVYLIVNKFISSKFSDGRYTILINTLILIYGIFAFLV